MKKPEYSDMTPKQLRALANQKEQEMNARAIQKGRTKYPLYIFDTINKNFMVGDGTFSAAQFEGVVQKFKEKFKFALPAGTKFLCIMESGKEVWYDETETIPPQDSKWAAENLVMVNKNE